MWQGLIAGSMAEVQPQVHHLIGGGIMKHWLAACFLLGATASLTGCYYDPGYSYVRGTTYSGDAYYGQAAPVYSGGYYAPAYGGYYGDYGGYGCCYSPGVSIGISRGWYGGGHYYRGGHDYYRGHGYHGSYDGHRGYSGGYHDRGGHSPGRPPSGAHGHGGSRGDGRGDHHH